MCGIIGFNGNNKELGLRMTQSIAHRGPDDEGVFCDENITLGNRRLSIIDLSQAGHQPMTDSEGQLAIVYNGEVYNFKELKGDLENRGYKFKGGSDTEVILYGYQEYGPEFFNKLRGMWALALYDKKDKKLVLSRDYFGIKPLFYYFDGQDLAFGSEIKTIKEFLNSRKKNLNFSKDGISQYFVLGYTVQPFTVFENIKKVKPGEIVTFDLVRKSFSSQQIKWETKGETFSDKEIFEKFEKTMLESVKTHLISDVPVGVFLSGGSDSTLVALMMKKLGANLNAFTLRIEGKSDADYAKKIANFASLDHHEIKLSQKDFEEQYEKCWQNLDEPIADSSLLPSLAISKAASERVKVVLTGEGGDELFLGYPRYQLLSGLNKIKGIDPVIHILDQIKHPSFLTAIKYLRPLMRRVRSGYFSKVKMDLLGSYLENAAIDPDVISHETVYKAMAGDYKKQDIAWPDRNFYLPNDLLYKTDFATMTYSIEGRVPFLDREVFEFSNSLPEEWKLENGVGKRIVKEYLAKNIPPELIFRKKEGFSVPLSFYQSEDYKKDVHEAVTYCRDVLGRMDIDNQVFDKLSRDRGFMELFELKFRHFLFATLSFYKTTSKTS